MRINDVDFCWSVYSGRNKFQGECYKKNVKKNEKWEIEEK